ncbi:DUF4190 domain-containing protein [Catellatospora vulcania]|uniref:DUF4190 domain-containing protein n=1 Tax=Catellatospora vulcania TaxID=1460450 RepID=UPI001E349D83|nr:DUF4190 domain-containing protein [Catellatospora vulcania]
MTYPPPPAGQDPYSSQPDPYAPPPPANPYATPPSYGSPAVPGSPVTPPASGPPMSVPPVAPQSGQPYGDPYKTGDPYAATPQPYGQQPYGQQPPYGGYPPARPQNSMALVALILSLVGLMTWITAPIGAILGHSAMKQIRQTGEDGEGMAKAAIIVGWIITGLGIIGCLCAFGLPFLALIGVSGASTSY